MQKGILIIPIIIVIILYIIASGLFYVYQEKLIFYPQKLDKNHQFSFYQKFEEFNIKTYDGALLNGVLFRANSSKGLIFYLHGNAGSIDSWGNVAETYTDLKYDVFILDYRGYGKSEGSISSQEQLYQDVQIVYDFLIKKYNENNTIVLGYSIGTGLAAKIASKNNPKLLILQAPYFSMIDIMKQTYSLFPTYLLKYTFKTNEYIKFCNMPIVIFHGDKDELIDYKSSLKLKEQFKTQDTLITLREQGHNEMTYNEEYKSAIKIILAKLK